MAVAAAAACKLNRRVFTKCSLRVIYTPEVTDRSLIEAEGGKHTVQGCKGGRGGN